MVFFFQPITIQSFAYMQQYDNITILLQIFVSKVLVQDYVR